jgi:hyperosmotically inducible protein
MKKLLTIAMLTAAMAAIPAAAQSNEMSPMEAQIRKEIVTLPYYSLFDHITFKVENGKATLIGEVNRPSLKKSIERVVGNVEGVSSVDNQIEILPTSPNDDRIRVDVYRAIYYNPMFSRYAIQAVPPIHIIVRNGDVTLEGVVNSESEKNMAGIRANGVPGVFSVTNNLQVVRD